MSSYLTGKTCKRGNTVRQSLKMSIWSLLYLHISEFPQLTRPPEHHWLNDMTFRSCLSAVGSFVHLPRTKRLWESLIIHFMPVKLDL